MSIEIGSKAPKFELYGYDLKPITNDNFAGKNLTLVFVPGAFTGVCTKEICSFQDVLAEFNKLGSDVIAISVDSPFSNKAWADKNGVKFPVLSDYSRNAVKAFGAFHEDFAGMKGYTAAKRSVFVIDKNGNIAYKWISDDPGVEPDYKEVEAAVGKLA